MPIPKEKKEMYGRILGHMLNMGKDKEEAKDITDRAVKHKEVNDKKIKKKDRVKRRKEKRNG